ncbi:MAG TPA: glutamine--fructose-6-phosphate transaminase (isomerizing) [Candidatus Thermoplasmatota archaeon]|nr:glutamine--fructose-6-phosphate transaminase (isomerizing) [Candidatus Thermoplasmatota archaeon]
MCGIIGYVGNERAAPILLAGLARLEYRGYDSAGVAVATPQGIVTVRSVGAVSNLAAAAIPDGACGIGHTRWATHGRPSEANAHPHRDCTGDFSIVHNGIIENFAELRERLAAKGHAFTSETDTEVLTHLVEDAHQGDLLEAVREALRSVRGSYAIVVMSKRDPGRLVATRHQSPLLIGLAGHGHVVASDATAAIGQTREVVYLEDGDVAVLTRDRCEITDRAGRPREARVVEVPWSLEHAEKGGFDHFMLKEIHEIPRALGEALRGRLHNAPLDIEGRIGDEDLGSAERILVLACGTSYHAGLIGKTLLESLAGVPVDVQLASEYRYAPPLRAERTLAICVSQSGETADTLEAMRLASRQGHPTLALTNVVGSTMTREADGVLLVRAGPEMSVAATKTFATTSAVFYLLAIRMAALRGRPLPEGLVAGLEKLPEIAREVLASESHVKALAEKFLAEAECAFYVGRQAARGVALEGALKLKEIAYLAAEGYAAGELKHGPIALLAPGVPVVACIPRDATSGIMLSNIQEVRARGAHVLALFDVDDPRAERAVEAAIRLPTAHPLLYPITASIALHLLAYHAANARGCEIDRPRNLAKSVTVE